MKLPVCPRCDVPIPADGPRGLCPKCLLALSLGAPAESAESAAVHDENDNDDGDDDDPRPPPPSPQEIQPLFPQLEIIRLV